MDGNHDAGNEEEEEEEDDDRNEEYDDDGGDGEGSEESEESEAEYADVDLDRNPHSIDFLYNVFQGCTPRWPANADNIWDPSNVTLGKTTMARKRRLSLGSPPLISNASLKHLIRCPMLA